MVFLHLQNLYNNGTHRNTKKSIFDAWGGTFLPAFLGVIGYASIKKDFKVTGGMILFFAGLSALGGYATSKMI